jgi:hypothetical protein
VDHSRGSIAAAATGKACVSRSPARARARGPEQVAGADGIDGRMHVNIYPVAREEPSLHLHRASVRTYYYAGIGAHSGLITTATHVIHNG